jgi:hypothetical protein
MGLNSSGSGPPGGAVVVIIVVVACFWFGWQPVLLFGLSIVKFIFAAAVTIASSAAVGAWNGFGTATAALRAISETLRGANFPNYTAPIAVRFTCEGAEKWLQFWLQRCANVEKFTAAQRYLRFKLADRPV